MRYATSFSGIESHSLAWVPLGWVPVSFSEIDRFCCALLEQRWPEVPNLGDSTRAGIERGSIDLLMGSTPCQDFSVAGRREGMGGARGRLTWEFLRLVGEARPAWVLWENVPGVLSIDDGRAFGAFLGRLEELGYGWAYRTLDAQYVGGCALHGDWRTIGPVPQRRRRVFVVAHSGDGGRLGGTPSPADIQRFSRVSASVLFERESLSGNLEAGREAGEGVAGTLTPGAHPGGFNGRDAETGVLVAPTLFSSNGGVSSGYHPIVPDVALVSAPLTGNQYGDHESRESLLVPIAFNWQGGGRQTSLGYDPDSRVTGTVHAHQQVAVAFQERGRDGGRSLECQADLAYALTSPNGGGRRHELNVCTPSGTQLSVRRLTPLEAERLMGFPDDYTLIDYRGKPARNGPRYRAIGNSIAVYPLRWIGRRVELMQSVLNGELIR